MVFRITVTVTHLNNGSNTKIIGSIFGRITDIKIGPDGFVYILSFFEGVYQIKSNVD
ncbi:MAG TPA: hypothetical protein VJ599_01765 [Nitrososphaeraceae archaeon]|nr:hypothetical protein [Nitrososphaeraceae archaeon]